MTELVIEEETPQTFFRNEVREIGKFAKNPRRAVTRINGGKRSGPARSLSYEEMATVESDMIRSGRNIKPKFSKEGKMERKEEIKKRLHRLFLVIRDCVKAGDYFDLNMLIKSPDLRDKVTSNSKYFDRVVYEDLKRLVGKRLIYRRGTRPVCYYLGPSPMEKPVVKKKGVKPSPKQAKAAMAKLRKGAKKTVRKVTKEAVTDAGRTLIPEHITIDINVKFSW